MKEQMPKRSFPLLLDAMTMRGGVCACVCVRVCACVLATWVWILGKVGIGGGMEETSVQHLQPANRRKGLGSLYRLGGSESPSAREARRVIAAEGAWRGQKELQRGVPL